MIRQLVLRLSCFHITKTIHSTNVGKCVFVLLINVKQFYGETHTHTQPFNGLLSGTTQVGRYQKKHALLTPVLIIGYPLSPSSIYNDPWHPLRSVSKILSTTFIACSNNLIPL